MRLYNSFKMLFISSILAFVLNAVSEKCVLLAENPLDCKALINDEMEEGGTFNALHIA
jgi:hypothetical protein